VANEPRAARNDPRTLHLMKDCVLLLLNRQPRCETSFLNKLRYISSPEITPPPKAPTRGCRNIILSNPRGWALNRARGTIDVPLCLVTIQRTLIRTSVEGPGVDLFFWAWATGGVWALFRGGLGFIIEVFCDSASKAGKFWTFILTSPGWRDICLRSMAEPAESVYKFLW